MDQKDQYKQVDKFIVSQQLLGKGSFGDVYKGMFKDDNSKIVAVKVISIEKISQDAKFLEFLKREIDIMQKIEHPNIVRLYGASRTTNNLYMFMEYCNGGDLKGLLKKKGGKLAESEVVGYFKQISDGFQVLYKNNVIHRDIKPANILLNDGIAKITDFGFARFIDDAQMEKTGNYSKVGTPLYMSPQILNDEKFSSKCDVWSLAMVLYELLYGKTPWTANSPYALYQSIKKTALTYEDSPEVSQKFKDTLKKMLIFEDKDRLSWEDLFLEPIISN